MRLKEVDLTLPKAEKWARQEFQLRNRCVAALYQRLLPKIDTNDGWKVLVEGVERVEHPKIAKPMGVFTVEVAFDYGAWLAASLEDRKRLALEALQSGVTRVAENEGWPRASFEEVHRKVLELNFVNEWTWPEPPKASPDRKHKAQLYCSHEPEVFRASFSILDRDGREVLRHPAFETPPHEIKFAPRMGKLQWVSNTRVALFEQRGSAIGKEIAAIDLPT